MSRSNGNLRGGEPKPTVLHRILAKAHENAKTQRAIADTAKGRRIKAQQARAEKKSR